MVHGIMYAPKSTTSDITIKIIETKINKRLLSNVIKMISESQTKYNTKTAPNRKYIKRWCDQFLKEGNMLGARQKRGQQKLEAEAIKRVDDHFSETPKCSIRQAARALGMKKSTVHNVANKILKLWPYKISVVHLVRSITVKSHLSSQVSVHKLYVFLDGCGPQHKTGLIVREVFCTYNI